MGRLEKYRSGTFIYLHHWQIFLKTTERLGLLALSGVSISATYFGSFIFGYASTSLTVIAALTVSYFLRYCQGEIGTGLAYWGLVYAAAAIVLLGIAVMQSHANCIFLIGDCYQPSLPTWLSDLKRIYWLLLLAINAAALLNTILNFWKPSSESSFF